MSSYTTTARAWNAEKDKLVDGTAIEIVVAEWAGIEIDEEVRVLELDAGAGRPLSFDSHKRGSNWTAVLVGRNAANMERQYHRYQNRLCDYSTMAVGDAVEVGADYTTSGGNRHRCRFYLVIVALDDDKLCFVEFDTPAEAMKAARIRRKNIESLAPPVSKAA